MGRGGGGGGRKGSRVKAAGGGGGGGVSSEQPKTGLISGQKLVGDRVEVTNKGPIPNKNLFATNEEAYLHLQGMGFSPREINSIDPSSLREVASLLPEGSKRLGSGAGATVALLPDGSVVRIPYNTEKWRQYYAGDASIYSTWVRKAGKVYVEGKPYVETASKMIEEGKITAAQVDAAMDSLVRRIQSVNPKLTNVDMRPENVGLFDGKWVVLDGDAIRTFVD